jgi:DNA polymerase (family 10)
MENVEIAAVLGEVADLLEIKGGNRFKIRAYRNAAQKVASQARPLRRMVEEGEDLTKIPGIGKDMSSYITELVRTGGLERLRELQKDVSPTVTELLKLDGVGAKTAAKLYHELGVDSLDKLRRALEAGEVSKLEGLGPKTAEKMQRELEEVTGREERFLLSKAESLVRPLVEHLRKTEGLKKLQIAGSYRRRSETVGDIDILAICDDWEPVMDALTTFEAVDRVEQSGETRGTVVLRSGLQVDLRILPEKSYGAALHYFTGSKSHNVAVRKMGVERGLKISEYGVFEVPENRDAESSDPREGKRVAGEDEESVYRAVDLPWIPPELRESRGELEAAGKGKLPDLVSMDDIRGDLQMHSTWSDGKASIEEMARACADLGYEYMAITDHSSRVGVTNGLDGEKLEKQWKELKEVRRKVEGITILSGMEVDVLDDGSLDLDDEHLEMLDLVVAAIHSNMDMDEKEMTARVVKALSHPSVSILAHPTGRKINQRKPISIDLEKIIDAAVDHEVALECNAMPDRLDLADIHLRRAAEKGALLVVNTDAHRTDHLRYMSYGVDQARRGWLEPDDVLNTRSLSKLKEWLKG